MTQTSLFDRPGPSRPNPLPSEWTELEWANGRRYRWRLDTVRTYEREIEAYVNEAPGPWRWELEVLADDETWRVVRLYTRRDEIWRHIRGSPAPTQGE